jgi:putative sulfate transporter ychM
MTGSKHKSNAELVAQGVGNFMSALFGGIPATGAIARTAANVKNGGRTPVSGMVHAFTLLLILLFLMPYASYIPMSCLAAILIIVGYNMSGWRICVRMLKTAPKSDIAVLIITFLLTLFFDLVIAIEFGMVLAAFLFLKRMADIAEVRQWAYKGSSDDDKLSEEVDLKYVPDNTIVYEIFGALFFGAANVFTNFEHGEGKNVLIIRMRNVPAMDISGLEVLEEILETCKKRGLTLILSHVNEQPYHVMEKAGFIEKMGKENICENIDVSLERAEKLGQQ